MPFSTRLRDHLLLLLFVAAGYWILFVYTVPNDLLDCWLPWRHFISKSFHNGIVPLWNPYQQLGYPVYADLQGPLFSLENFITGSWTGMNLTTLQCLLFVYLYLAAAGMYTLGIHLFKHRTVAISIGLAYALGGFFNLHLQHFFTIVSAALMPWMFWLVLKFLQDPKWKYLLVLTLIFHLLFTTGNQTFNVINLHLLVLLFTWKIIALYRKKMRPQAWKLVKRSAWLGLFILLSVLPVLVAFWQTRHYVDRYEGLHYAASLVNSMTPAAFQSFIDPLISTQSSAYLGTDMSMSGYFFGFISLAFALVYFVFAPGKTKWLLMGAAAFFALMSLGAVTPLHYWMYKADPLLRLFRFPAYYMFYFCFILVLSAGAGLKMWLENRVSPTKVISVFSLIGIAVVVIAVSKGLEHGTFFYQLQHGHLFEAVKEQSLAVTYTFSALLVLVPGLLTVLLYAWKKRKWVLLAGISIEMIVTCNLGVLQVSIPQPAAKTDAFIAALPKNFALPANTIEASRALIPHLPPGTWRNYHLYFDQVSPEFFNSFFTHSFIEWENDPGMDKTWLWKNKRENSIRLKTFEPGLVVFETPLARREKLQLNQLNFPYWKLYFDHRPANLAEGTIVTIDAPEGTKEIRLVFENPLVVFCFWFALGFTALVCFILLFLHFHRPTAFVLALIFLGILCRPLLPFLFKPASSHAKTRSSSEAISIVNKAKTTQEKNPGTYDARFELNELLYRLLTANENKLVYIDSGNFNPPVIDKALAAHFTHIDKKRVADVTHYTLHGKMNDYRQCYVFDLPNNINSGWNIPAAQLVSDSVQQTKYCLLNESQVYGPGTEPKGLMNGHAFFVAHTEQQLQLTGGELLLVLDIAKDGKSMVYQASPLFPGQANIVFYPDYHFTGHETVKLYYWLNGKGQAQITRQELLVIPAE